MRQLQHGQVVAAHAQVQHREAPGVLAAHAGVRRQVQHERCCAAIMVETRTVSLTQNPQKLPYLEYLELEDALETQ